MAPSLPVGLASLAFRVGHSIAPHRAGQAAFALFCSPPRSTRDRSDARFAEKLAPLMAEADPHRVMTSDAIVQAYLWRTSVTPARGRVLLLHGWTGQARIMGLFVKPLRDQGFDCVAVDLPGHGQSTGRLLSMPIGARAVLAVADALGPFTGLVAHSFGGPIAALAVEGGVPIGRALSVDRLVLIASPHALTQVARNFGAGFGFSHALQSRLNDAVTSAAGRAIETINTGDFLAAAATPCLIIHDEQDADVPFSDGEAIVRAAGPLATLLPTKGLGHRRIIVMPHVVRASVRFLSQGTGPDV